MHDVFPASTVSETFPGILVELRKHQYSSSSVLVLSDVCSVDWKIQLLSLKASYDPVRVRCCHSKYTTRESRVRIEIDSH